MTINEYDKVPEGTKLGASRFRVCMFLQSLGCPLDIAHDVSTELPDRVAQEFQKWLRDFREDRHDDDGIAQSKCTKSHVD